MKINKINYEAFAIDYLEGNLSSEDRKAFENLMAEHPRIKQEIDDYLEAPLLTENLTVQYEEKADLQKKGGFRVWPLVSLLMIVGVGALIVFNGGDMKDEVQQKKDETEQQLKVKEQPLKEQPGETKSIEKVSESIQFAEVRPVETKEVQPTSKGVEVTPVTEEKVKHTPEVNKTPLLASVNTQSSSIEKSKRKETGSQAYRPVVATTPAITRTNPIAEVNVPEKINAEPVKKITEALASIKSLDKNKDFVITEADAVSISDRLLIEEEVLVVQTTAAPSKKKSAWLRMLTPQAYKDINLEKTIAVTNLKSAVTEIGKAIVPEVLN